MNTCLAPCPVVFDLDGTLIDSAPDIHAAVNAVLRLNKTAPLTLVQVRSFIGGGVDLRPEQAGEAIGGDRRDHHRGRRPCSCQW